MIESAPDVVMRTSVPRASESMKRFLDLFMQRFTQMFEASGDSIEPMNTNLPKEERPLSHQQRLLRELEEARQESNFLEEILVEKEFDEVM